jgi:hypothetical protein
MASLFKGLLGYKRKKLYDYAKSRKDNRLHLGYDYSEDLMRNTLSDHILRNSVMNDFTSLINDYVINLVSGIRRLKLYKNYTVKKDDTKIR